MQNHLWGLPWYPETTFTFLQLWQWNVSLIWDFVIRKIHRITVPNIRECLPVTYGTAALRRQASLIAVCLFHNGTLQKAQFFRVFLFSVMDGDRTLPFATLNCNKGGAQQTSTAQRGSFVFSQIICNLLSLPRTNRGKWYIVAVLTHLVEYKHCWKWNISIYNKDP